MKREVVHVPTRELAEEVLRVAKDNGLMEMINIKDWEYDRTETYFRPEKYGGFANLSYVKTNSDTIITAQEFLSRYEKEEVIIKPLNERYEECLEELDNLVDTNNQLRKENAELKEQLKAIEDQPKVGDVCLFWDDEDNSFELSKLKNIDNSSSFTYKTMYGVWYENCIKATPENIKAKIKELQDDTKTT